ncbi:hypothetical protein AC579_3413 [Pseudocercospora musae]|uniref:Uncharacterized protein n=1 Tax=Pseudocercospora musae TaxID=113226 RepID=A0A139IL50_9PEZI|nr:hypothetical protein AC579_3413 [Pseudocercospora musae]
MNPILSPTASSTLSRLSGELTIAILSLSGTTVAATAVPLTTGPAVADGTTIAFRSDGITLSDGQVFSLGFDGLVDGSTTAKWTSVSIATSLPGTHQDLRRRQEEEASTPKDQPIQVEEPQTSSVPPNSPTNAYSSTAITGLSSPSPSSYTGLESSRSMTLTGTATSQITASITISTETTLSSITGTKTVTSSATQSGASATSSAGAGSSVQQQLSIAGWMVAVMGLLATIGGFIGL